MDRRYSNYLQNNPCRYDGHLSLFGRRVLKTLIKKWTSDRNRSENPQSRMPPPDIAAAHWPHSKKVLTFSSEQPRAAVVPQPPTNIRVEIPNENNNIDEPLDLEAVEKLLLPVSTANELFKTTEQHSRKDEVDSIRNKRIDYVNISTDRIIDVNIPAHDMINPVTDVNRYRSTKYDLCNRLDDGNDSFNQMETVHNYNEFTTITGARVNWDDMFDTELLPVNTKLTSQPNASATKAENAFDILFSEVNNKVLDNNDYKLTKTKEYKQNYVHKAKHKNQPDLTDVIPKKVKKISEKEISKNIFRKQKYTKTVRNWLDAVNPNNPVEEESTCKKDIAQNTANKTDPTVFDKSKDKPSKKKVQTKLANKDGKMKFGKPKDNIESEKVAVKTDYGKSDKDKTIKPKFVAPIKSQVPVRDVDYEVVSIDSTNIQDHTESLSFENKYCVMVLIYSNGFSQLNKHHTEDTCKPEGFIASIEDQFFYFKGVNQSYKKVIKSVLENNKIICYDGKSLLIYLKSQLHLEFNDLTVIDAKIGGSLLDPDNPPENFSDIQKLLSFTPEYTIATECVQQKTAWYATLLNECAVRLTTALKANGLWSVFVDIEMKLMPIIAEMERRGVTVDLQKLKSMEDVLLTKMKEVEQKCYNAAGRIFQLNSTVQIRTIIYDELQLDTKCNVKIKETISKGAKSTSETMLRSLVSVHPLPKLLLEYRHLHKAHATFLIGIAQHVKDGIVRPTWVQTAAATGRIASNNPNLQAIPKAPFSLILFPDENNSDKQTVSFRSVYSSRAGYSLVGADFQHVECRVFAQCAGDAALARALRRGSADLFRALAAQWLNKPESEVSSEDRERTKRIVYASLYGAGCRKLMDILGVSYEQTLSIIASFNRTFPSLKSFGRSVVSRCEQNGGRLSTLCGRTRRFKNIDSQDFQLKSQAERQAVNFVVQGSAADLCKMAMVLTTRRLRTHNPPVDGYLLLQIHDELVWEIRHDHVVTAAAIIKEVMEGCGQHCGMAMALPVAISTGTTWGDMAEYTPPLLAN